MVIVSGLWFYERRNRTEGKEKRSVALTAQYVGSESCVSCHGKEEAEWRTSQHRDAMALASERSVLGNFNEVKFTYAGLTSTFFRRSEKFFVNTEGRDGKLADFEVKYTFGVAPLQQYLIEFPDGRLQALSMAWDARPKEEGGQRWFHLYPQERVTHDDELHWTRPAQNWNFMCADCHSTGLRKNYDPVADRFRTQWSEISVGCEACHGPGSNHVAWAGSESTPLAKGDASSKGLVVQLNERRGVVWSINPATGIATRSATRARDREIEICAQCHARRSQIAEGYTAGKPFLDYYRPVLLAPPLYYPDGQQRGEVYNWGSFLQSKMYASGVTCSDCHDPHSGKLRAAGNALCATCHLSSKYDIAEHYHHKPGSAGSACAACHMPATTYIVIDPRRDHSLRVPRPDLSVKFGAPNACNGCHTNRDARWAAAQINAWYGHDPQGYQRFAQALSAANAGEHDADSQLRRVAGDATQPAIARASALAEINAADGKAARDALAEPLKDPNPLIRLGALQSLAQAPPASASRLMAAPLLSDPVIIVRLEAASILTSVPAEQLSVEQRAAFERAAGEYVEAQRYNADRPEARVNLGTFYASRGDPVRAEEEIKAAIRLEPLFIPAYVNLADVYRARGADADSERIVREGLKIAPKSAILHHVLGLALVRMKRTDEAVRELALATRLEPGNARFAYVYAVALHSTGKADEAIASLEKTLAAHPNDRDILRALASFHGERGNAPASKRYRDRLRQSIE